MAACLGALTSLCFSMHVVLAKPAALGKSDAATKPEIATAEPKALKVQKGHALRMFGEGELFGHSEVIIGESGLMAKCHIGYYFFQKEKPEEVLVVNSENKTYLAMNLSEWVKHVRGRLGAIDKELNTKSEPLNMCGFRMMKMTAKSDRKNQKWEVYLSPDLSLKSSSTALWSRVLGTDEKSGMPLCARQLQSNDLAKFEQNIDTKSWIKTFVPTQISLIKEQPKFYAVPPGYKRAKDKASLYLSDDGSLKPGDLDDLFMSKVKGR